MGAYDALGHREHQHTEGLGHRTDNSGTAHGRSLDPGGQPSYSPSLLGDLRLNGRGNRPARIALLQRLQQTYGNRAVQRYLHQTSGPHRSGHLPVQREEKGQDRYHTVPLLSGRVTGPEHVHTFPVPTAELPHQIDWIGTEWGSGSDARPHSGERLIDEGWSRVMTVRGPSMGKWQQNLTRYLETEEARSPYKVTVDRERQRLLTSTGGALETKGASSITKGSGEHEYIFSMSGAGEIYAADMMRGFGLMQRPEKMYGIENLGSLAPTHAQIRPGKGRAGVDAAPTRYKAPTMPALGR